MPGLRPPPIGPLELCGVGADERRLAIAGSILDGIWAVLVTHRRSSQPAKAAIIARMAAMARLCPHLASVLDSSRFVQEPPVDPA